MEIYFAIFGILALFSLLSSNTTKSKENIYTALSFLIIVAFQGLRWERGTDWDSYNMFFHYSAGPSWYYEYGWWFLNKTIRDLTNNYNILLIIECGGIMFLNIYFCKYIGLKNKSALILSVFASCIFPVRFVLASGIVLIAFRFILEKKIFNFVLCVLIASTFHIACLLIIPFYFIPKRSIRIEILLLVYTFSILISFFSENVLSLISSFNNLFLNGIDASLQNKVDGYITEGIASYAKRSVFSIALSFINGLIFIYFLDYLRRKNYRLPSHLQKPNEELSDMDIALKNEIRKEEYQYLVLYNLYVFGLCFNRIVSMAIPYLSRIGILASAGFTFILLLGIQRRYPNNIGFVTICFIIYQLLIYLGVLFGMYTDLFIPYNSIL